jgi:hypothetical protein
VRRLALIALLTSAPAFAQVTVSLFQFKGQENLKFNAASCSDDAGELRIEGSVTGQYNLLFNAYPFGLAEGKCPLTLNLVPPLGTALDIEPLQLSNPTNPIFIDATITPATLAADACTTPVRKQVYVCAQFVEASSDGTTAEDLGEGNGLLVVDVDTTLPPAATVTSVGGGDGVVFVNVDAIASTDGDVTGFRVEHRLCPLDGEVVETPDTDSTCGAAAAFQATTGSAPTIEVVVENGRTAELRVIAVDDFGNESDPTDWQQGTPVADLSPLELYDGAPNELSCDLSSCESADAAMPLGALVLWLRRRRRPLSSARATGGGLLGLALVFGLFGSTSANAQSRPDDPESKRLWNGLGRSTVSMSVGSYEPNIDADSTFPVYGCFFKGATLPQLGGAADLHVWDGFGSLQLSVGLDVTQANGFAQPLDTASTCQKPTTTAVQLTMASVRPGLTYRFDPLLDWVGIPLVPYGRVGFVGMGYLFSKGGEVAKSDKQNPLGARLGAEGALGLMLALDFLDGVDPFTPDATRRARADGVFDHTFIFVEGAVMDITTFGQPGFDLSPKDDFLKSGLPASFKVGLAVELL